MSRPMVCRADSTIHYNEPRIEPSAATPQPKNIEQEIAEETEIIHGGRYEAMFDSKKWFLTEPQRHGEEGRHPSNHSWKALFGVSVSPRLCE